MLRLSLRYVYRLGAIIHPLTELQATQDGPTLFQVWSVLSDGQVALTELFAEHNFVAKALKSSWEAGPTLLDAIAKVLQKPDFNAKLEFMDLYPVQAAAREFETKFTGEIHYADCYFVTQKRGLDTTKIISDGSVLFPADLPAKVPEAINDVREAGKCIAFELGTAAGFHLFRATEAVLRKYFDVVSSGKRRPKSRNIGSYIEAMKKLKVGDAKVLAAVDQMRNLHRNPLFHPEDSLTVDEAINLMGIVQSAIAAMLREIPMPKLVLTPPPTGGLLSQAAAEKDQPA